MDARGEPRPSPRSALEVLVGGMMEKVERGKVAELCDQVADLIERDPKFVVRVARRLAVANRPAPAAAAAK